MTNDVLLGNNRFRVAQKIIIFRPEDNAVLMLRFSSTKELPRELWGKWDFPGGGLESAETLEEGLLREIREEIGGVEIQVGGPLLVGDWWQKSNQQL